MFTSTKQQQNKRMFGEQTSKPKSHDSTENCIITTPKLYTQFNATFKGKFGIYHNLSHTHKKNTLTMTTRGLV